MTDKDKNVYSEENCSLACYVCNNAKSDLIYYKDFKHIALGTYNFLKSKYPNNDFKFSESFYEKEIEYDIIKWYRRVVESNNWQYVVGSNENW